MRNETQMNSNTNDDYHPQPYSRYQEIVDLSTFISEFYAPRGAVDPYAIAREKGITLSYNDYGKAFDGMLEHRSNRFHIYCNLIRVDHPTSKRARFTVAHELGHYFIDDHRRNLKAGFPAHGSKTEYCSSNPVEKEADSFAANLLLPKGRFRLCAQAQSIGLGAIRHLANTFGTSITATAVRYVDLEISPVAIIHWNLSGFAWKRLSLSVRNAGCRKTIESFDEVPHDSATGKLLAGKAPPGTGYFESIAVASIWFPFVDSGTRQDIMLHEEAMALGRFGSITVLTAYDAEFRPLQHLV